METQSQRGGASDGGGMSLHLEAGKYALYLWPAYGLSAVVIAGLVVESLLRSRRWRQAAEMQERMGDAAQDRS